MGELENINLSNNTSIKTSADVSNELSKLSEELSNMVVELNKN